MNGRILLLGSSLRRLHAPISQPQLGNVGAGRRVVQPLASLAHAVAKRVLVAFNLAKRKGIVVKDVIHLLEAAPARLLEEEEDVDKGGGAKRAENEVEAPLDVLERGGREKGEAKVAGPVEDGGERDGLGANVEGDNFGRVDPTHGTGAWLVYCMCIGT